MERSPREARNGCQERYPDLEIGLSHGGGFVPWTPPRRKRILVDSPAKLYEVG